MLIRAYCRVNRQMDRLEWNEHVRFELSNTRVRYIFISYSLEIGTQLHKQSQYRQLWSYYK